MTKTVKPTALVVVALFLAAAIGIWATQAQTPAKPTPPPAKPAAKKPFVLRTADEMKWTDVPEVKGVQESVMWGNEAKGAHGTMNKFAAGAEVPLHTHTSDMRGVIISGTLVITPEGRSAKELGAGSYFFEPAGAKHTTACKAGADCILYRHMPGPFDVKTAEPTSAPK